MCVVKEMYCNVYKYNEVKTLEFKIYAVLNLSTEEEQPCIEIWYFIDISVHFSL